MLCQGADPSYPLGSAVTQLSNPALSYNRLTQGLIPKVQQQNVFLCLTVLLHMSHVGLGTRGHKNPGSPGTELGSSTKASALNFWVLSSWLPDSPSLLH